MSPHLQAKLLHVLQDGEYMRLGGKRSLRANARILASTNRKLEEEVAKGAFREDLYYRLNVIRVEVPPLRERPEDIQSLCHYFVEKYRERYGSPIRQLPPELLDVLLRYNWPGNIRQLENVIKRYLILADLDLALSDVKDRPAPQPVIQEDAPSLKEVAARAAEQAGREAVLRALEQTNWNRKQAARQLGICYKALLNKLKKWDMDNRTLELRN
jgi:transcriptional regulator with PAS, ATPase and Fis domain